MTKFLDKSSRGEVSLLRLLSRVLPGWRSSKKTSYLFLTDETLSHNTEHKWLPMARPVLAIGPHSSKSFWICSSPQNQEINRRSIGKTWDWLPWQPMTSKGTASFKYYTKTVLSMTHVAEIHLWSVTNRACENQMQVAPTSNCYTVLHNALWEAGTLIF